MINVETFSDLLQLSSAIFSYLRETLLGNIHFQALRQMLGNLQTSSESGHKSSENRQALLNILQIFYIIKQKNTWPCGDTFVRN